MRLKRFQFIKDNAVTYCLYAAVLILSAGVYYLLNNLSESVVKALLDFYKTVVEIFFNNSHYYSEEAGWYDIGNAYVIGRGCLGLGITSLIFCGCGSVPWIIRRILRFRRAL